MKHATPTAPSLVLLLGVVTASTLGLTGWSTGAGAQSATAPATIVPPAATTTAPPRSPAPGSTGAKPHQSGSRHASRGVSGYLDALHDELAITTAEEPLWGTFADEMRANAAQLGQAYRQRREQLPTMNALADMSSFINLEQMRLDGLKKSSTAFTALYQTMPPDQQKVADTVFLSDMPGAPHHGRKAKASG